MIIVQLVPKLLARKIRKSTPTPTQGQDVNKCLSCLYKKDIQLIISVKVKQSHYRPDVPRGFQEVSQITMAQDGGKVVSLTHRPLLPAGNTASTHFC